MKVALPARLLAPVMAIPLAVLIVGAPLLAQTPAPAVTVPAATANPEMAETPSLTASLPSPSNPAAHTTLTGSVMEALTSSPQLGLIPITVKVTGSGTVSLNGVVATDALAQEAVNVVKAVPGVSKVQSNILVNQDPFAPAISAAAPAPRSEANPLVNAANSPQAKVEQAFSANSALVQVSARAYGNEMTIFGTVPSGKDKQEAETIAKRTVPEFKITNIIWVNPHPLAPPPLVPR